MKLAVAILISGSGTNMVQLIKSMDDNHPAYPSVVISNNSDAPGLEKAQYLGVPTEIINENYIKFAPRKHKETCKRTVLLGVVSCHVLNCLVLSCL